MRIHLINGPNLNLLGKREPEIYGSQTFDEYFTTLQENFPGHALTYLQSNHEGALIDALHAVGFDDDSAVVINPGGYTHTSIALADAVSGIIIPVVEVHISNILERESFRHRSYIRINCAHSIMGEGIDGYRKAVEWLIKTSERRQE
ncbi:MAG: 3-dehydroquinate dehydratase-2 [Verrucomicrobiales bacterium]|jgi:3-dehydroquinate dehydratase-2